MGIVGVAILTYEGDSAVFDTLLMSCRALGRGIEDILLTESISLAKARGMKLMVGKYVPTKKNGQVEHFYGKHEFSESEDNVNEMGKIFVRDIGIQDTQDNHWFKEITSNLLG